MPKTNLKTTFFRARLVERNLSIFVWEFGSFGLLNDFYRAVKNSSRKHAEARVDFYLVQVCGKDEVLLDSVLIDANNNEMLNYAHPRRIVKTGVLINE